jgi:hypothetical protein
MLSASDYFAICFSRTFQQVVEDEQMRSTAGNRATSTDSTIPTALSRVESMRSRGVFT